MYLIMFVNTRRTIATLDSTCYGLLGGEQIKQIHREKSLIDDK